jgi:hypothetical protein
MTSKFAAVIAALIGMTAAGSAQPLQAQMGKCLAIPGMLQRLACYDAVAKAMPGGSAPRMASAPATAPAPVPAPIYVPQYAPAAPRPVYVPPASSFGGENLPRTASAAPARVEALSANVTAITFNGTGRFTVTLDNGQVWRQMAGDESIMLRGTKIGPVRLTRGALGSYDLQVPGQNTTYRVSRLQ